MGSRLRSRETRSGGRARLDRAARAATLVELTAHHDSLAPALAREVRCVAARGRLEGTLRSIAIDLLGSNESDEFPAACADWVSTTIEAAVSSVSDTALEALVRRLDSLLIGIPPEVAHELDRARTRRDAGFD